MSIILITLYLLVTALIYGVLGAKHWEADKTGLVPFLWPVLLVGSFVAFPFWGAWVLGKKYANRKTKKRGANA